MASLQYRHFRRRSAGGAAVYQGLDSHAGLVVDSNADVRFSYARAPPGPVSEMTPMSTLLVPNESPRLIDEQQQPQSSEQLMQDLLDRLMSGDADVLEEQLTPQAAKRRAKDEEDEEEKEDEE